MTLDEYTNTISEHLYTRLKKLWTLKECRDYAACYLYQYELRAETGNFNNIEHDVIEDMAGWI